MKLPVLSDGTGRESIYPGAVMTREHERENNMFTKEELDSLWESIFDVRVYWEVQETYQKAGLVSAYKKGVPARKVKELSLTLDMLESKIDSL